VTAASASLHDVLLEAVSVSQAARRAQRVTCARSDSLG
jgi:hypothetical protein